MRGPDDDRLTWLTHLVTHHDVHPEALIDATVDRLLQIHANRHADAQVQRHVHRPCPRCTGGTLVPTPMRTTLPGWWECTSCDAVAHASLCGGGDGSLVCVCGLERPGRRRRPPMTTRPYDPEPTNPPPTQEDPMNTEPAPDDVPEWALPDAVLASTPAGEVLSGAFRYSATVAHLFGAIVEAFGEMSNVAPDGSAVVPTKQGGSYSYRYMTLGAILSSIRGPLAAHGLAVIQAPAIGQDSTGRSVDVSTRLIHKSGEWIESTIGIGIAANADAQAVGSAMTYARRYGVTALLAIAAGDDDDGQLAAGRPPGYEQTPSPTRVTLAQAKGRLLHAIAAPWDEGGPRAGEPRPDDLTDRAAAFWSYVVAEGMLSADEAGTYSIDQVETIVSTVLPVWTFRPDADEAPATAPPSAAPDPEVETPPEVVNGPEAPTEGVEAPAPHPIDVDALIARAQAMTLPKVREALDASMLSSAGASDTIRRRLVELWIREATHPTSAS